MGKMKHNFRELKIWQESMNLAQEVFLQVKSFPAEEKFGLSSQLKRAAISVPSNIAEGSARVSGKHFIQYLETSLGSLFEIETQLLLARQMDLLEADDAEILINITQELQKMIAGFIKTIHD